MATIDVKDAVNATVAIEKPNANGRAAAASSRPVALSTEDKAVLDALAASAADVTTPVPVKFDQTTPGMTNGVQVNAALPAGTNTIGAVAAVPRATANGATSSRVAAAASTNATSLKASAGNLVHIDVFNSAAYTVFLKFYNKASSPTVGTDTPVWTIPIAAGTGYSRTFPAGKSFATGIAYAITKLIADSDTTAVVALDLTGAIDWI